jgi:hypothetical protein
MGMGLAARCESATLARWAEPGAEEPEKFICHCTVLAHRKALLLCDKERDDSRNSSYKESGNCEERIDKNAPSLRAGSL